MGQKHASAKQNHDCRDRFNHFTHPLHYGGMLIALACFKTASSTRRNGFVGPPRQTGRARHVVARIERHLTALKSRTHQRPFLESCRDHPGTNDATLQLWVRGDRGSPYEKRLSRCRSSSRCRGDRPRSYFGPFEQHLLPESLRGFGCRAVRAMSGI
jgi:hypothetical protein